jgi:hypothetical protein
MLAASLLQAGSPCRADPGYYVVSPYDEAGVRTLDARYWTVAFPNRPVTSWPELGLRYGVSSRWATELLASYIGSTDRATRLSTLSWLNDFLLTQGEAPLDLALHTAMVHDAGDAGGNALELGPALQTDVGRTQLNANVFLEHSWGGEAAQPTQMKYQWQVLHRWRPPLHLGIEGFGELGPWDHWLPLARQSHRAGPVLAGTLPLAAGQSLAYHAAYLLGSVYGRHDARMLSVGVQYGF